MQSNLFPPVSELTDTAKSVLKRYYVDDETEWKEIASRTSQHVLEKDSEDMNHFYNLMLNRYFIPNSPCMVNSGKDDGGLSACFVVDFPDSIEGIFKTKLDFALIAKKAGGCGTTLSKIRPKNFKVDGSSHEFAGGPVNFFNTICHDMSVMTQGGFRDMAMMGTMSVYHPDIVEFITAKAVEGRMKNTNISVVVDDRYMEKVKKDEKYKTFFTFEETGEIVYGNEYNARDIFELLVKGAWTNGEPGILFKDRLDNTPYRYSGQEILAVNPCVTGDTWIDTSNGARQVCDLVDLEFNARVGNNNYSSAGFFRTGEKDVYRLITKKGYSVFLTHDHRVQVLSREKKVWKEAKDLTSGDNIVLQKVEKNTWGGEGSSDEGYLLGQLVGDGTFSENRAVISIWDEREVKDSRILSYIQEVAFNMHHANTFKGFCDVSLEGKKYMRLKAITDLAKKFGIVQGNKTITKEVELASSNFYEGFLRGLFDADGSVMGTKEKGVSVRLSQSDIGLLEAVQRMLLRLGIVSTIYKDRRKAGMREIKGKEYFCKSQHELSVSKRNMVVYNDRVGFYSEEKQRRLDNYLISMTRGTYKETFADTLSSLTFNGKQDVYDATVKGAHSFSANGIICHNCGEQPLPANGSCILGHLDISKFVDNDRKIPMEKLELAIRLGVRFLDRVISVSSFPTKEISYWASDNRPIGLGIMGFADYLLKRKVAYGSEQSAKELLFILKFMYAIAEDESIALGKELGVPDACKNLPIPRRNVTLLTIAPTGSTSLIAGCNESLEPFFSDTVFRSDSTGSYELKNESSQEEFRCAISSVGNKDVEVSWEEHLLILATAQSVIDSGVSKTINFRNDATMEDISNTFISAWESNVIKGLTVYRNGSRDVEVLTTDKHHDIASVEHVDDNACPLCGSGMVRGSGCRSCPNPACNYSMCDI